MLRIAYIGERIAAQGFRLLGASISTPHAKRNDVWNAIRSARKDNDLVLLDQGLAELVNADIEALLMHQPVPPILVVPGMQADGDLSGSAQEQARRELGIGGESG